MILPFRRSVVSPERRPGAFFLYVLKEDSFTGRSLAGRAVSFAAGLPPEGFAEVFATVPQGCFAVAKHFASVPHVCFVNANGFASILQGCFAVAKRFATMPQACFILANDFVTGFELNLLQKIRSNKIRKRIL
jgi:hypothetical protein